MTVMSMDERKVHNCCVGPDESNISCLKNENWSAVEQLFELARKRSTGCNLTGACLLLVRGRTSCLTRLASTAQNFHAACLQIVFVCQTN
jgi:hypothetical protein